MPIAYQEFVFDGYPYVKLITRVVGVFAQQWNPVTPNDIIASVFQYVMQRDKPFCQRAIDILITHDVPPDHADHCIAKLINYVETYIRPAIYSRLSNISDYWFDCELQAIGKLVIIAERKQAVVLDPEYVYRQHLQQQLDDGDYIPARIRAMVNL